MLCVELLETMRLHEMGRYYRTQLVWQTKLSKNLNASLVRLIDSEHYYIFLKTLPSKNIENKYENPLKREK